MGQTNFSGPLQVGDLQYGQTGGPNVGFVILEQQIQLPQKGSNSTTDFPLQIPANSIVNAIDVDVLTAYDSVTSALLSIGETVGGTEYANGVSLKTAGRASIAFTAAQLANMSNLTVLGVPTAGVPLVNFRVVTVGTTANGFAIVTIKYAMLASSYS
jgi:hypothetical protein